MMPMPCSGSLPQAKVAHWIMAFSSDGQNPSNSSIVSLTFCAILRSGSTIFRAIRLVPCLASGDATMTASEKSTFSVLVA